MDVSLFFAGTAGSVPTARRGLPALLLRAGGERILIDCGEGTQQQLLRSVGLPELDAIFVTHLHLDHWLGLLGMVKTFDLRSRERPLNIYGPPGLDRVWAAMRPIVIGRTGYPLQIVELEPHEEVRFDCFLIAPFSVKHRIEAYGYAFVEDERPGRFDAETARRLGSPKGPTSGGCSAARRSTASRPSRSIGRDPAGRRIVFSGDTAPCQAVEVLAHGADVLVHEATFLRGRARPRARDRSTPPPPRPPSWPARRASACSRSPTSPRATSRATSATRPARSSPSTVVPRDFDAIEVPFPERGGPALVKADASRWGA